MRRKIKKKNLNIKIIVIASICAFFLVISIGYSYLQTQLKIEGKATIVAQEPKSTYTKGESTCTHRITKDATQSDGSIVYNINLSIVNNDEQTDLWDIAFDVPKSFQKVYTSYQTKHENGRLHIYYRGTNNEEFEKGSTQKISFKIKLEDNKQYTLKNITLNNLLVNADG